MISISTGVADFDLEGLETRIRKEVIEDVERAKAIALQLLKDSDHVSPAATVRPARTSGGARTAVIQRRKLCSCQSSLVTKREARLFLNILSGSKTRTHRL